ncbi:hypothetical protein HHI36_009791 [Cryptolaemus montrouzieri]|uniref:Uncharacterized protein n=1 Tax=Cryptolaemus montrouzieri TaxID=559131 RepID=A0ABD2MHH6_9CUCU
MHNVISKILCTFRISSHYSVLFAGAIPRTLLTDDEICQLLENEDSGDDGAIDHFLEKTDDEWNPRYESQSEDLYDDKELLDHTEESQNRPRKRNGPNSNSSPLLKKIKSNNKIVTDERLSTSGIKVESSNEGDSSETNDGEQIVSWDTST